MCLQKNAIFPRHCRHVGRPTDDNSFKSETKLLMIRITYNNNNKILLCILIKSRYIEKVY